MGCGILSSRLQTFVSNDGRRNLRGQLITPPVSGMQPNRYSQILLFLLGLLSAFSWIFVLLYLDRGFDFTDEGFYLNSIASPYLHTASVSRFQFLYFPIFALGSKSILGLRLVALGGVFLAAVWLALGVTSYLRLDSTEKGLVFLCILAYAPVYYSWAWLPTPSYNHANLLGLSMVLGGGLCLLAERHLKVASSFLAVGLVISLLTKITSGVLAFFLWIVPGGLYLFGYRTNVFRASLRTTASAFALTGIGYFLLMESPTTLLSSLAEGAHRVGLMSPSGFQERVLTLFEWPVILGEAVRSKWFPLALITAAIGWRYSQQRVGVFLLGVLLPVLWGMPVFNGDPTKCLGPRLLLYSLIWTGLCFLAKRHTTALVGLMMGFGLPIYTYGTDNPPADQSVVASILVVPFILMAMGQVLPRERARAYLVMVLLACSITSLSVYQSAARAYRQVSLFEQNEELRISNSTLKLSPLAKAYIETLRSAFFEPRIPVIDLTGASPGALFVVAARPVGAPWMLGGEDGSQELARYDLSKENLETLRSAWILTAPDSPRALETGMLQHLGLEFPDEYEQVIRVIEPARAEVQILWKPRVPNRTD